MNAGLQSRPQAHSWTSATCEDSFAFYSITPLVVQRPRDHRLLIVIPVRRECCSWSCGSSARATYFTAATNTSVQQAQAGVDFVEARGTVVFEAGQQRAQLAVEILPGLTENAINQRAFAVVLEDPVKAIRASTVINIEPALATNIPLTASVSALSYPEVLITAIGLVMLVAWWIRERRCRLPRRGQAFRYKVLLLSRRNSGARHEMSEALSYGGENSGKKSGVRRSPRRGSSFKNWKWIMERRNSETTLAEGEEAADKKMELMHDADEDCESEDEGSDSERDFRQHLASIQCAGPR
ncbi:hypothetical protein P3T76_001993 [Phytophthora citrophthora]|uniref:Calx-beta domain-containing protein n=1 Tax=Phytophthora citrophthora TaxID=4793 RepID=A0AAD9GXP6_9STRA|nr:hypothetical protein P3T76_001993 [Phytophthora citrophthora]